MGVYLLGVVTLFLSHYIVPERLYPWLGGISGVLITGLGCSLWLQRDHREGSSGSPGQRVPGCEAPLQGGAHLRLVAQ